MKAEHSRRATNTHTQPTPTLFFVKGLHHPTSVFIYKQDRQGSTVWKHLCTSHSAMVNPCLVDVYIEKKTPSYFWFAVKVAPSNRKLVQNNQGAIKNLRDLSEAHLDNFPHPGNFFPPRVGHCNMGNGYSAASERLFSSGVNKHESKIVKIIL